MASPVRNRVHQLIDQLSDEELTSVYSQLAELCYDSYMLQAIQTAKRSLTPGDSLTSEEAIQFLSHS